MLCFYRARQVRLGKMVFRYLFTYFKIIYYIYPKKYFSMRYRTLYYLFWHTHNHSRHLRSSDNHACQHDRFFFFFWLENPSYTLARSLTYIQLTDINNTTAFSLFYSFHFSYFDKIQFLFFILATSFLFFSFFISFFVRTRLLILLFFSSYYIIFTSPARVKRRTSQFSRRARTVNVYKLHGTFITSSSIVLHYYNALYNPDRTHVLR